MKNKITAIIVDDEPANVSVLQKNLKSYCPSVVVLDTATNITDAEILIHRLQPQLVFLDVEMPNGNGFDLLQKLLPLDFNVVFTTAFNKYAVQAFKFSAVDYLLKPIDPVELIAAVQRVADIIAKHQTQNPNLQEFLNNMQVEPQRKKIALTDGDGIVFQDVANIMYISSDANYVTLYLGDGKKKTVIKPLADFEEILPRQIFFRIHHSYIINLNYIKKYHKGRGGFVEMLDENKLEVAVRKRDEFLQLISQISI